MRHARSKQTRSKSGRKGRNAVVAPVDGEVVVRQFQESDLVPVHDLIHRTIDSCYAGVYPPGAVRFFRQFHSEQEILARSRRGEVLVAEAGCAVVATGALVGGEILGVFVTRVCQGCGYGKAIMLALEERARSRGLVAVELSVSLPSKGFYERLGYEILEECSLDAGEGERLRFWKARKSLR